MDKLRTVSQTKREFYTYYNRPINSVYRRIVEELMVEMHLLSVNVEFRYNPIYALGVLTSFQRFMDGYNPEQEKENILKALFKALNIEPDSYKHDNSSVLSAINGKSVKDILEQLENLEHSDDVVTNTLLDIKGQAKFKYSRLFAIGLYTILTNLEPDLGKDAERRNQYLAKLTELLNLPKEKLLKDVDSYRANLEKMEQILLVIEDSIEAERKKREKKEQEKLIAPTSSGDI